MYRTSTKMRGAAAALALGIVGGVAACYPGDISDIGETDLVATFYDLEADFSAMRTYFMPDTIVRLEELEGEGSELDIDRTYDAEVLAEVAAQLGALGWARIDEASSGSPDVVVLLTTNSTSYAYWISGCWYCYWGWYPWGPSWGYPWGPGYHPGYPWAPVYVGTRTIGTLLVTMLTPISTGPEIPAVWVGAANGLLSRDDANTASRVLAAVNQMFAQSPYLDNSARESSR